MLATASADKTIRIWDAASLSPRLTIQDSHNGGISDICWSPTNQYLCSASDDTFIYVWELDKAAASNVRVLRGHEGFVFTLSFHPHSLFLASGSFDETIRIWDVKAGICIRTIPAHSDPVTCVHFNIHGNHLVSSSYDGLIRVWEVATGDCIKTLIDDHNPPVSSVSFSPNGQYILASSLDNKIRLWDQVKARCVRTMTGHTNEQFCIMSNWFLQPQKMSYIVSGSENGSVYIWDLQSGSLVHQISPTMLHVSPSTPVLATACHPLTGHIAAASIEPECLLSLWKFTS